MSITDPSKKQYGLILTGKNKKLDVKTSKNVFCDEVDDVDIKKKQIDVKKTTLQAQMKQKTKKHIEDALDIDPSIFQYDEVYDQINEAKEKSIKLSTSKDQKKPKYVHKLLHVANERKLEQELLNERKAQKEMELEKDKFGDKEKFVTSSYKAKMDEVRQLVNRRTEEEVRDQVMDVTKQDGLTGFYKYMLMHDVEDGKVTTEQKSDKLDVINSKESSDKNTAATLPSDQTVVASSVNRQQAHYRRNDIGRRELSSDSDSDTGVGVAAVVKPCVISAVQPNKSPTSSTSSSDEKSDPDLVKPAIGSPRVDQRAQNRDQNRKDRDTYRDRDRNRDKDRDRSRDRESGLNRNRNRSRDEDRVRFYDKQHDIQHQDRRREMNHSAEDRNRTRDRDQRRGRDQTNYRDWNDERNQNHRNRFQNSFSNRGDRGIWQSKDQSRNQNDRNRIRDSSGGRAGRDLISDRDRACDYFPRREITPKDDKDRLTDRSRDRSRYQTSDRDRARERSKDRNERGIVGEKDRRFKTKSSGNETSPKIRSRERSRGRSDRGAVSEHTHRAKERSGNRNCDQMTEEVLAREHCINGIGSDAKDRTKEQSLHRIRSQVDGTCLGSNKLSAVTSGKQEGIKERSRSITPKGLVRARPRQTNNDEIEAVKLRCAERRTTGRLKPVIVDSDNE